MKDCDGKPIIVGSAVETVIRPEHNPPIPIPAIPKYGVVERIITYADSVCSCCKNNEYARLRSFQTGVVVRLRPTRNPTRRPSNHNRAGERT